MKKFVYIGVLLALLLSCNNNKEEIESLFPDAISLEETSSIELTSTNFSKYLIKGNLQKEKMSGYPTNIWANQGWKVRNWGKVDFNSELKDLNFFLVEERGKYGKHSKELEQIDLIINTINDKSGNYLLAYFYKEKPGAYRKPPDSNDYYYGWLFFYYLDLENQEMIRITNAYR